jgi:hypothetical protein
MCDAADTLLLVLKWLAVPLLAALVGGYFGHRLASDRDLAGREAVLEKEADVRRRHFRKFALSVRFDLERHGDADAWKIYNSRAGELMAEGALVESDFTDPQEFKRLLEKAGYCEPGETGEQAKAAGKSVREFLRDAVYDVAEFARRK